MKKLNLFYYFKTVVLIIPFLLFLTACSKKPGIAYAQDLLISDSEYLQRESTLVDKGIGFIVILQTPVNTAINNIGDPVEVTNLVNIYLNHKLTIPKGAQFIGQIENLSRARTGFNGEVLILFHTLRIHDNVYPIHAQIVNASGGKLGGESSPRTEVRKVLHSVEGIGDYVLAIPSGPRKLGEDLILKPGTQWRIILTEPVTL